MKKRLTAAWRSLRGKTTQNLDEAGLFFEQSSSNTKRKVLGLSVVPYGRMGNSLLQISNAILLARALELQFVQLPKMPLLDIHEPVTVDGLTLLPSNYDRIDQKVTLTGTFFRETKLERIGCTMETRRQVVQKYIVPYLTVQASPQDTKDCLTIHLRSGDVFEPNPHPGYTQPPLSFYTKVIEDAREKLSITQVQLVFEDRKNPCVERLETFVKSAGLALKIQSGSFQEDVSVLLSARNLVFGYGTFGLGICLMSKERQSVYVFGASGFPYSKFTSLRQVTVFDDHSGIYPRVGDWEASEAQLDLMLSLPQSALAQIDETKPAEDGFSQWWTHLDTQI